MKRRKFLGTAGGAVALCWSVKGRYGFRASPHRKIGREAAEKAGPKAKRVRKREIGG